MLVVSLCYGTTAFVALCASLTNGYSWTFDQFGVINSQRDNPLDRLEHVQFLRPNDFIQASISPVEEPSEEDIMAMQRPELFEGDIRGVEASTGIFKTLRDAYDIFKHPLNSALNLRTYPDKLWQDGKIPYILADALSDAERATIAQAFEEYREKTCIKFVPKSALDTDYILITKNYDEGCSSYVGRAGGNQTLSLQVRKCFKKGIVAHELMHSLGFFHEHSRPDRDDYVDIVRQNIKPGMLRNFEKYPHKIIDIMQMPYDYDSVMHYHALAFTRNGRPTIQPRDSSAKIGQRIRLSDIDADKVNRLYKCPHPVSPTTTPVPSTTPPTTTITSTIAQEFTSSSTMSATSTNTDSTVTADLTFSTEEVTPGPTFQTSTPLAQTTREVTALQTETTRTPEATTTTTVESSTVKSKVCEDKNDHCSLWAEIGHCRWSETYMSHYCRRSCRLCQKGAEVPDKPPHPCSDQNLFCSYWAKVGECRTQSKFMQLYCKKSCDFC